jgi:EmrB/QacA subfamily drug resistance transporter
MLIASLGVFMAFLDNTIVSIAFPNMLKTLHGATLTNLSWIFNVYNLALGALLVPAGRLADLLGRRRMFSAGVVTFTVASALCAVAPSVGVLIAARALQGAGAAIIIPSSLGLILHAFPDSQRSQSVALWTATGALAAGIGPSIGGLLVNLDGWRLVFLINLPVGVVVWRLAGRQLVESRAPGRRAMPDLAGALVMALSIGLLSLAIVQGKTWGWIDWKTIAALLIAIVLGVGFVRRCKTQESPILDLELFRSRSFAVSGVLTLVGGAGFFALGLANILYLMQVWRYSALTAGLAGTPAPFVAAATAIAVGKLAAGRDPRPFVLFGAVVWAAGPLWLLHRFTLTPNYLVGYLPGAVLLAIGIGVTFPMVSAIAVAGAPGGRFAGATALNSAIRQVGAALGVAVLVALVGQPTLLQVHGAFEHAWLFSAGCFGLVALGGLALGRPSSEQAHADLDGVATRTVVPSGGPAPRRRAPANGPVRLTPPSVPQTVAELLGTVPLFATLAPETRESLAERTSQITLGAGEWLFRQGDDADALYVVRSGRVEIVDETPGRDPTVVRELSSGSALGELALICSSQRTASVRVRRDARLLRVTREDFGAILESSPAFSRVLLQTLGDWLSNGRVGPPADRGSAKTIAVVALTPAAAAAAIDVALATRLEELADIVLLKRDSMPADDDIGHALSAVLDRVEHGAQHVVLAAGVLSDGDPWGQACVRQADRTILVVDDVPEPAQWRQLELPRGGDVILLGPPLDDNTRALLDEVAPRLTYRVRGGADRDADVAVVARRIAGRSIGLVLSGGGARCFTHIGVIEELHDAGVRIDRIGGTSMGAFIGALLAQGMVPEEIDAVCYEEWVRHNPVGDYRPSRTSLLRGERARVMLERNLPGSIEDLTRGFFCATVDLITARPIHHRRGLLAPSVGASMALPIFVAPVVLDGRLLLDGGLMDNLPTEAMASESGGPIIAVDVSEPSVRSLPPGVEPEVPSLMETLYKVMLLSESDDRRRRSFADVIVRPDFEGVGILEFHMLDRMREVGRRAAAEALENAPPEIFG